MNDDLKRWDEIAKEWVEKVIPNGRASEHLTKPALKELLGNVKGKKILDAGCGSGRYSGYLASLGAVVTGIDGSPQMIKYAKRAFPEIYFQICDLTERLPFEDKRFDLVVSDAVLMSLADIRTFMSESHRILNDQSSMVVSVLHPAFNHPTMRLYRSILDKLLSRKVKGLASDYFQKKTKRKDDNATFGLNFYHRTIEEYSQAFNDSGFLIQRVLEPRISDKEYLLDNPQIEYASRLPRFIFFKLIKQ